MAVNPRKVSWNNTYIKALGEIILNDRYEGSTAYAEQMMKRFPDKDFTRNSVGRAIRAYKGTLKDLFTPQEEAKIVAKFFSNTTGNQAKQKKRKELMAQRRQGSNRPSPQAPARTNRQSQPPSPPTEAKNSVPVVMPDLAPVTLEDGKYPKVQTLRESMCRFPFGDPGDPDFAFCGRGIARGSYCEDHARFMYQPKKEKKESTV